MTELRWVRRGAARLSASQGYAGGSTVPQFAMIYFIDRYFLKQPKFRRFVTRLLEGNRDHDVAMLGTQLRVNSMEEFGYLRAYRLSNSSALLREEVPIIINLASLIADGDTFVDIGANVGVFSLTLARLMRLQPRTRFHAFEPNPDTYRRLSAHTEAMGVQAYNIALSDHSGTLEFLKGSVSHVFTTVENSAHAVSKEVIPVPCKRLDEMDLAGNSLVLKIDVEGQETEVLNGAAGLFAADRIKAVYLDGYKERSIEKFLTSRGFTLYDGKTLLPTEGGIFSLLALRKRTD